MNSQKYQSPKLILALILFALLEYHLNLGLVISSSEAQLAQKKKIPRNPNRKTLVFVLPNEGAPGKSKGAITRGTCSNDENKPPLTALIPGKNMGLTIAERPTFWFYLPYQASSRTPVEFALTDAQGKEIYKQNLQLTNTPGVIGVTLPANATALEVDKTYKWELSVNCTSNIDAVNGRIKRVKASALVMNQLQMSRGRDRIIIYAENGFWYDTLTGLIELRRQNPQDKDLKADWEDLLKLDGVQLSEIATEPIVSCCQSK
jgi:hypothetical protein